MKIALCLSGLPRAIPEGFDRLLHSFINKYNPDIFIHTWLENPFQGPWEKIYTYDERLKQITDILSLYKPKAISIEKCHVLQPYYTEYESIFIHGNISAGASIMRYIYNPHSMFESVYLANELKRKYEIQNNFTYDCVIRCRMDIGLNDTIDFEKFDMSFININHNNIAKREAPFYEIPDHIAFSSSKNMDNFCDLINKIRHVLFTLKESPVKLYPEFILARYVNLYSLPVKLVDIPIGEKLVE
jgi:hypothetical protein